jgi:hypothetical protein
MAKDVATNISQDGLRYKSRPTGSPFGETASHSTMSCFKCGLHKSRALGSFKKMLGKSMFVCFECKPPVPKEEAKPSADAAPIKA